MSSDGERMKGCCGSVDTGRRGHAFMIAVTLAIIVESTSWVRRVLCCRSIESRILLAIPIMRSHDPPMWEECGGLRSQLHPCSPRYFCTALSTGCNEVGATISLKLLYWASAPSDRCRPWCLTCSWWNRTSSREMWQYFGSITGFFIIDVGMF